MTLSEKTKLDELSDSVARLLLTDVDLIRAFGNVCYKMGAHAMSVEHLEKLERLSKRIGMKVT